MCVYIIDPFLSTPLKGLCFPHHAIAFQHKVPIFPSALGWGATQRRAVPAAPFPKSTRGNIKNISGKPTAQIISRRLSLPRPKERDSGNWRQKLDAWISDHRAWLQAVLSDQIRMQTGTSLPPDPVVANATLGTPARMLKAFKSTGNLKLPALAPTIIRRFWVKWRTKYRQSWKQSWESKTHPCS